MTVHRWRSLNGATQVQRYSISSEIRKQIKAMMPNHYYSTTRMTEQKQMKKPTQITYITKGWQQCEAIGTVCVNINWYSFGKKIKNKDLLKRRC